MSCFLWGQSLSGYIPRAPHCPSKLAAGILGGWQGQALGMARPTCPTPGAVRAAARWHRWREAKTLQEERTLAAT